MKTPNISRAVEGVDPTPDILACFAEAIDPDHPGSRASATKASELYRRTYPLFFMLAARELSALTEPHRPLDMRGVATYVGKSVRTVQKWIAAGLPHSRVLGSIMVTIPDLDAWVRLHRKTCFSSTTIVTKEPTKSPRRRRRPRK
jgi:hypothetical protein